MSVQKKAKTLLLSQALRQCLPERSRVSTRWVILIGWLMLVSISLKIWAQAIDESTSQLSNPRVLILHSYHEGFTWTDNITRGIRGVFAHQAPEVELLFEFMDVKRLDSDAYLRQLRDFYHAKYVEQKIDVIIASDDHALEFLLGQGLDLFPGIPIVFCAVNGYDPVKHKSNGRQMTGVVESIDITATLEIALTLHPEVEEVVVITDKTLTGQALKASAEVIFRAYEDRLRFTYLEHHTMEQLQREVAGLPRKAMVFAFIFTRDAFGRIWSHEYNLERLASHCSVPIYSVWEFYLGHGIVGGMLTSGQAHGELAGRMALRILQGESPRDIPVVLQSPNRYMFDYAQLQRFGVKETDLPENSIVIDRPFSVYEEYKLEIWSVILFVLVLLSVVIILILDVLLRRRTERALQESEARFRRLAENAKDMIYRMSLPDGQYEYISPAVTDLSGYSPEEWYHSPKLIQQIIHSDWHGYFAKQWEKLLNGEIPPFYEYQIRHKSGEIRWVNQRNVLIRNEEGNPVAIEGIVTDITDRKQAEEAIKNSREQLELLVDSLPSLLAYVDSEQRYLYVNQAYANWYGKPKEAFVGQLVSTIVPEKSYQGALPHIHAVLQGEHLSFENVGYDAEGRVRAVRATYIPHIDAHGEVKAFIAMVEDISQQKQAEQEIRTLNAELEERVRRRTAELEAINKELNNFAYVVSHDLKAPLRGISRLADWLTTDYADVIDDKGKKMAALLIGRVTRMDNLIDGILNYSRIGRLEQPHETIALTELVHEVLDLLNPPDSIHVIVDAGLPVIVASRTRMMQVFQNLIGNAIKFMNKTPGKIRVQCEDDGSHWTFTITDNGPGIEERFQERIFQIFQTLQPRDKVESTGIGLALVKKIIELYGGKVWVESTIEQGSTFVFTLPKCIGDNSPQHSPMQEEHDENIMESYE